MEVESHEVTPVGEQAFESPTVAVEMADSIITNTVDAAALQADLSTSSDEEVMEVTHDTTHCEKCNLPVIAGFDHQVCNIKGSSVITSLTTNW